MIGNKIYMNFWWLLGIARSFTVICNQRQRRKYWNSAKKKSQNKSIVVLLR